MHAALSSVPGRVATLVVIIVAVIAAGLSSGGSGARSVAEAAGGWLSAQATPLSPAGPAFAIWTVIYLGLLCYGVWQLVRVASPRHRRVKPWLLVGVVLNSGWLIVAVVLGNLVLSAVVIIALLATLTRVLSGLGDQRPDGPVEAVLLDGVQGLYLGWVTIATVANLSALLASAFGAQQGDMGVAATLLAILVLLVAGVVGVLLTRRFGGRLTPALALSWGVAWIAIGRAGATPAMSVPVAIVAALVAVLVLAHAVRTRHDMRRGRVIGSRVGR